jgi:hypothetical protein
MTIPIITRTIRIGWYVACRHYLSFLLVSTPAALLLLLTVFSEYSVNTSGVMQWMEGSHSATFFWLLLFLLRLFAYAMMICGWTWLAGRAVFEGALSPREAISRGVSSAFRCMFAVFPVWMLSVFLGFFIVGICRLLWIVYSEINVASALLAVSAAVCFAFPVLMLLVGKFMFVIPVSTFERLTSIEALSRANGYIKWRSFLWAGSLVGGLSALVVISLIVPTWSFYSILWGTLPPEQHVVWQSLSIAFTCITAPVAVIMLTALYFAHDLQQDETGNTD